MSEENYSHDCESCGASYSSRQAEQSLLIAPHELSDVKHGIAVHNHRVETVCPSWS